MDKSVRDNLVETNSLRKSKFLVLDANDGLQVSSNCAGSVHFDIAGLSISDGGVKKRNLDFHPSQPATTNTEVSVQINKRLKRIECTLEI